MLASVKLKSNKRGELNNFLSLYFNTNMEIEDSLKWKKTYNNPIEISEIIGTYIDNFDNFNIKMWITLDKDIYIKITKKNANEIIKYLFERYPY